MREFTIQADELEQLQEMKKKGQGDRNPTVAFLLLLEHDPGWVVPGSRTALSACIEIGYLGEQGGQRPGIIHSRHIIYFHKPWWGMQAGMQQYQDEHDMIFSSCGPSQERVVLLGFEGANWSPPLSLQTGSHVGGDQTVLEHGFSCPVPWVQTV